MMPLCHKCTNAITEEKDDDIFGDKCRVLIGCKECPEIHDYYDAKRLCPVLKELDNE